MKKHIYSYTLLSILIMGMFSCQSEEEEMLEKGRLRIGQLNVNEQLDNARIQALDTDHFLVELRSDPDIPGEKLGTYGEVKNKDILLNEGGYYVFIGSKDASTGLTPAFDDPYYAGASEEVFILPSQTFSTQVTCLIQNAKIGIQYSKTILNSYPTRQTVITDNAGGTLTFEGTTEDKFGYFDTTKGPFTAEVSITDATGKTIKSNFSIDDPKKNTFYNITIDGDLGASNARLKFNQVHLQLK